MKTVYLYGCSGHAKVILDLLQHTEYQVKEIIDDYSTSTSLYGHPISHQFVGQSPLLIAIGDNATRKRIAESCAVDYISSVHPSAIFSSYATIGKGSVVMAGAIVQAGSTIGKHCIINTGASVDHESVIEDYVHISPHATLCGNVHVGEGTWIGAGAIVIQGIKIGKWCVIAAGSVVTKDIPDGYLAAGNRCKLIKQIHS